MEYLDPGDVTITNADVYRLFDALVKFHLDWKLKGNGQ